MNADQIIIDDPTTPTAPDAPKTLPPVTPNTIEMRGYEVARLMKDGSWEAVAKYRPTQTALGQAKVDADWLQERGAANGFVYQLRAIISCQMPNQAQMRQAARRAGLEVAEELHLEEDEEEFTLTPPSTPSSESEVAE